jgi:hypothetical protein
MTVPSTPTEATANIRAQDVHNQLSGGLVSATTAIRIRILLKRHTEVPVAAFQSSI